MQWYSNAGLQWCSNALEQLYSGAGVLWSICVGGPRNEAKLTVARLAVAAVRRWLHAQQGCNDHNNAFVVVYYAQWMKVWSIEIYFCIFKQNKETMNFNLNEITFYHLCTSSIWELVKQFKSFGAGLLCWKNRWTSMYFLQNAHLGTRTNFSSFVYSKYKQT